MPEYKNEDYPQLRLQQCDNMPQSIIGALKSLVAATVAGGYLDNGCKFPSG